MSLRPEDVTVALAVEDALPVLLAGLGLVLLVRADGLRRLGEIGAVLIVAGGAAKVLWKLIAATVGVDVAGLDELLFPLLATGFTLVVASLLHRPALVLAAPLALALSAALTATWPCLVLMVAGSTAVLVIAIRRAWVARDGLSTALFVLTLAAAYGLVPLAAQETQTLRLQWLEQSVNTAAQAAFALGAWRLLHPTRVRSLV